MTIAIGVEGGGTRTRAVIVDAQGREVGRAEAAGAVVTLDALEAAAAAVSAAVREAAERSEVALPADALWAGLPGAGYEPVRHAVARELKRAGLARDVRIGTDVEATFHAAFPAGPGIVLIAGTGSVAWARDSDGDVVRVGGWGQQLGDDGSGYALGLGALRAVVRAEDRRSGPTRMREDVLNSLGFEEPVQLIGWARTATKAAVAELAPIVFEAAADGDTAASRLVAQAVSDLESHVSAILEQMGPRPVSPTLVLWGGLIGQDGPLRGVLVRALVRYPVDIEARDLDPALGAARLALATLDGARRHDP